jgi:hypothetical protein
MKSKAIQSTVTKFVKTTLEDISCLFGHRGTRKTLIVTDVSIRQMPENYRLAYFIEGRWICEPDLAANIGLAFFVFEMLLNHELKWDSSGDLIRETIKDVIDSNS